MRFKLLHHSSEWLVGDFEPPADYDQDCGIVLRVHKNRGGDSVAIKLMSGGTGVWDSMGRLVYYAPLGADLLWFRGSSTLLSLERQAPIVRSGPGISHSLKTLDGRSFETLAAMEVRFPLGFAEYLVLNPVHDQCAATWREAAEWGYVLIDIAVQSQLPTSLVHPVLTLSPPAFSLDGQCILSCNPAPPGWWTDDSDDYEQSPSQGGERSVGTITVHDISTNRITEHDVRVDLPRGWIPDHPDRSEWYRIWGPEFIAEREFAFWLPDDQQMSASLPLPAIVKVPGTLRTQRPWLHDD